MKDGRGLRNEWVGRILNAGVLLLVATSFVGCVAGPTIATVGTERKLETPEILPIKVDESTILVDARPAFEFSTAHIPKSVNMSWADFTEPEPAQRGILQSDLFAVARRLARNGIAPGVKVVVVGRGFAGSGEEGRIAWMLTYLGVANVQFADIDSLGARLTNSPDSGPRSAPMWKASPIENINVTRAEVLFAINKRAVHLPSAFNAGEPLRLYRFIDVRSEKAYLGNEGLGKKVQIPNIDAVNIPWREFFAKGLRPNPEILQRLSAVGVTSDCRIIVLDEDGVASAAVTMALQQLGFPFAGNYAGGLNDLMSQPGAVTTPSN